MQVATRKMKSMIFFHIIVNIINSLQDKNTKKPFYQKICYSFLHYIIAMKSTLKWVDNKHVPFLDAYIIN